MAKSQNTSDTTEDKAAQDSTPLLLLATIADTTWRMFVPSIGMTLLGVWLDTVFTTKPWLMIIGIIVGFAFAILLVKKQMDTIKKRRDR